MPTIGVSIGREGRQELNAALSHPSKRRAPRHKKTMREIVESLGNVVVLHFEDGTRAERLSTAHWPPEDWRIIAKAVAAREYIRTDDGTVHFTA